MKKPASLSRSRHSAWCMRGAYCHHRHPMERNKQVGYQNQKTKLSLFYIYLKLYRQFQNAKIMTALIGNQSQLLKNPIEKI